MMPISRLNIVVYAVDNSIFLLDYILILIGKHCTEVGKDNLKLYKVELGLDVTVLYKVQ